MAGEEIQQADTVLLISHSLVEASSDVEVDSLHNIVPFPQLVVNHRPNASVIKKKVIIKGDNLRKLIGILRRPFGDSSEVQSCMLTHHAIFLIRNGRASYINLSFQCGSYETSEDLIGIQAFDKTRWNELEKFFKGLGFKSYLSNE